MNGLRGLAWLLVFQSLGEVLSRGFALPLPGPVLGLILLLGALAFPAVRTPVGECADFLLSHLSLLFVPAGVGIMVHANRIGGEWMPIVVALVISTWLAIVVTALVTRALMRKPAPPQAEAAEAADSGAQP